MTFGISYGFERYTSLQNSRQANPGAQFDDPTRNWSTDALERVHSLGANAELLDIVPRTRVRFAYDLNYDRALSVSAASQHHATARQPAAAAAQRLAAGLARCHVCAAAQSAPRRAL